MLTVAMRQWNSGAMEVADDEGLGLFYLRISQPCIIDIWNHIVFLELGKRGSSALKDA